MSTGTLEYILKNYKTESGGFGQLEISDTDRDELPKLFNKLGFKIGVEIGVLRGIYSKTLCEGIAGLKLYGVDPYKAYVQHERQEQLDGFYKEAQERLKEYDYHFILKTSEEAAKNFDDKSIDFVYIDGDHTYENVMIDLKSWTPKVRPGGIISGHDFVRRNEPTSHYVVQAITAFIKENNINPWFVIGLNAKIPGKKRDDLRSWMWVKT